MKYAVINHEITNTNNENTFTFIIEGNKNIGDIVLCKTKKGNKLGRIVKILDNVDFTPTATAVKLNNGRKRMLSNYDRATLKYLETKDIEKALNEFYGYGDERAITSWLYNVAKQDYVHFKTDCFACKQVEYSTYDYESDTTSFGSYNFG